MPFQCSLITLLYDIEYIITILLFVSSLITPENTWGRIFRSGFVQIVSYVNVCLCAFVVIVVWLLFGHNCEDEDGPFGLKTSCFALFLAIMICLNAFLLNLKAKQMAHLNELRAKSHELDRVLSDRERELNDLQREINQRERESHYLRRVLRQRQVQLDNLRMREE